jgi:hypothetical protein
VDIQSLKLNDKIYIDNSWWNINKIADYNANINQLTKVELISIDTEIDLVTFQTGNGNPIGDTITAVGTDSMLRTMTMNNNVIMPGADAMVFGRGNTVTAGTRGVLIGDGQVLEEDGMVVSNLTVTDTINGEVVVRYKKYVALMTQTGTAAPTVTVLENSIGDIVWTRASTGLYRGTLIGAFTLNKTYAMMSVTLIDGIVNVFRFSNDTVRVATTNLKNPNADYHDNHLLNNTIEIRVYE